jgi:uncharacterized protein (TIGR03083 family)
MAFASNDPLAGLDPFDVFDAEAARLDRFFSTLDDEGWNRPSRCEGWSVRDVLGHLAGEELYNRACLDDDLEGLFAMLRREGVRGGFEEFNEWCVRRRRGLPVDEVLREWRDENGRTRERMRALGRDATLRTSAGPYPVGLQTFHYDSEYATHADDVGVPVSGAEAGERTGWRVRVALFVLSEQGSKAQVEPSAGGIRVSAEGHEATLPEADFVEATVGRPPAGHPLAPQIKAALRCLA